MKSMKYLMIHLKWYDEIEEHYFSVVDVVGILSGSKNPSQYWRTLKSSINAEMVKVLQFVTG